VDGRHIRADRVRRAEGATVAGERKLDLTACVEKAGGRTTDDTDAALPAAAWCGVSSGYITHGCVSYHCAASETRKMTLPNGIFCHSNVSAVGEAGG